MKEILLNNSELKSLLYGFSDWFYRQDLSAFKEESMKNDPNFYCVTDEYLDSLIQKDYGHIGFPEEMRGLEISEESLDKPEFFYFRDPIRKVLFDITSFIGARNNALTAFYPKDGYIGWHTNWNASGYNLIFSYSEEGNGFFKYLDPETKEIVKMIDPATKWTCKAGYFGNYNEKLNHFWHAAESNGSTRLTFSYIIPDEYMWSEAIDEIESDE